MSKTKNKIRVSFVGENARDVTGSMTLVKMKKYNLLLECGLFQSNSPKEDYKINSTKFPFKPQDLDFVFLGHVHIDHSGRIPALFAQGSKARVICPKGTKKLFKLLGLDSAFIMKRDCEFLSKKFNMKVSPLYEEKDVFEALKHFEEYDFGEKIKLNEDIEIQFTPSGHIISAAQIELWLKEGNQVKKILYTSDLGNKIPKFYTEPFQPVQKANLAICESTYSDAARKVSSKDRLTDLKKIETVVQETCLEKQGKVLIPSFSLDRTQNILTHLYQMFSKTDFNIPVVLDSPLATKLTSCYLKLLTDKNKKLLEEVLNWPNLKILDSYEESMYFQKLKKPMIIISASGFMQAGRSRIWAKYILPDIKSHILFIGFATDGSLAGRLRNKKNKTISIDGRSYKNRCGITTLHSFSSHIQYDEMLKYYSDINCEKLVLVHGNYKKKCEFGKVLQTEIFNKNKTHKVVIANKSTSLLI